MRYSTPTHPVYAMRGNSPKGWHHKHGHGGKPLFTIVGYEAGVPVPNPAPTPPKPGHWRVTPRGKLRMAPRKHRGGPMWPSRLPQPFDGGDPNLPKMSVRMAVRAAVAAGQIAPEDAPSWARG